MNQSELEAIVQDWPGIASAVKWEDDLVLTVSGKMFAVFCLRGPHRQRLSIKVDPERYLELTDQPGISPSPYMARAFWISIADPDRFARSKISEFVRRSYDLVRAGLSKKQQAVLGGEPSPPAAKRVRAKTAPTKRSKAATAK